MANGTAMIALEAYPGTAYGIVVNGTMNVSGANFSRSGSTSYTGSNLQVNVGGHLFASNNTFGWAGLALANGSLLNSGDVTGNTFNQNITIPAIDAALLANNLLFQDVYIQPGNIASGQSATLAPLGTVTTVNQHYVFNVTTGNLTVQPGGTLNVVNGAAMVAQEAYPGTVFGIVVNGSMNVAGSTFSRSGSTSYTGSILQVNAGGYFTAISSSLGWANLTLNSSSTDELQFTSMTNKFTISSGATININSNNFSNIGANGIVAVGTPSANIDLTNNYWGTTVASEIAAKILDHVDDSARPTVLYTPYLSDPPTAYFDPAGLPAAKAGASYSQTLTPVGGTGPATNFTLSRGTLPAGLSLSSSGVVSGTPTSVGSFTFTISADDNNFGGPFTANQIYWLNVDAPVITFTPATLPAAKAGVSFTQALSAAGGTAPYSQFVVSAGALPTGLTLSTSGTISGIPTTADGTFDFTVTARDSTTGLNAPYIGSRGYSLIVDNTPPSAGTVNDGSGADIDFQASAITISANWIGFSDSGSGISSYQWAIGTSPGATDVQSLTNVGNTTSATATGLSLIDGAQYYVSVSAIDGVGNISTAAVSNGVTVDDLPPSAGSVSDGLGADIDTQLSTTSISANWSGFSDAGSGVSSYLWAVGTTPGGSEVHAFTDVGNASSATVNGLTLDRDITYYVSVKCIDKVGNVSSSANSNGVTVVTPPPVIAGFSDDSGVLGDGITNDTTPTLNGTAEPLTNIRIYQDSVFFGQTAAAIDGSWQYSAPTVANGPHSFTAIEIDLGGHTSALSNAIDISIDVGAPTVTINQDAAQVDPTRSTPIAFVVHFSEPVTGFAADDIDLTSGTVGGTPVASVTGSGSDYTVTVTGMDGAGNVVATIPAGAVTDVAGNDNSASTSSDNSVAFDNVAPSVTINQDAAQVDPTFSTPILFKVTFSEAVTGFTAADVDLSNSTVGGTLLKSVSGSGADYIVSVTGMVGAGNVIATLPAAAAVDDVNNSSVASTSFDNTVYFNHVGSLQFSAPVLSTTESAVTAKITVTRMNGGDGAITVHYATGGGTATSGADFTDTSNTLSWADGDSTPQTINVPILDDAVNEGAESFTLTLDSPTGNAILGAQSTTSVSIAKSDGATINAADKSPQSPFSDSDGDQITLKLSGKVGTLTYFLTNNKGPIANIDLSGTDSSKSVVSITVKKPKGGTGDGRVSIGEIDGSGAKTLSLAKADLTGTGLSLTSFLGAVAIGAIKNGADITLAGAPPKAGQGTKITAGVIADGSDIAITGAPLAGLTATSIGTGTITAPSAGTISIKGKAKTKTAAAIAGDFKSSLTIDGTGLPAKVQALKSLKVAGAVSGSAIEVSGDVGSVSVGSFANSRFFAGYSGADDGTGSFNMSSTVGSFVVTAKGLAFAHSFVIASTFKNVSLMSADPVNGGTKFGFLYDKLLGGLSVKSQGFRFDPKGADEQNPFGDFYVKKI